MTLQSKKIFGAKLKKAAVFCAAGALLVSTAAPAHAYYNYGYGLSNLLWPVRALVYPLAISPWSYRSPAYMASAGIQAMARTAYRAPVVGGVYGNSLNYTEDQVAYNNGSGLLKVPQGTTDQINYARWVKPTDAADRELLARAPGAPSVVQGGDFSAPNVLSNQSGFPQGASVGTIGAVPPQAAGLAAPQGEPPIGSPVTYGNHNMSSFNSYPNNTPLPAPPHQKVKKQKQPKHAQVHPNNMLAQSAPPAAQAHSIVPQHLSSPLAAHFIETVNGRFDGDISKALKHSETRNLAEAMGLIDRKGFSAGDLSASRVQAISHIFKDQSLDPASKLDAMKILLRSSSGAPSSAPPGVQSVQQTF
ncbi:MAG: hypothetical protein IT343_21410 [Candidatus Melainabacteria bacterium]|jgi:hypothetical protein|nr:hypothetical protein [Candidatus Melainabacteria bacterium]